MGTSPCPSAATGCCAGAGFPGFFNPLIAETQSFLPPTPHPHPVIAARAPHSVQARLVPHRATQGKGGPTHLVGELGFLDPAKNPHAATSRCSPRLAAEAPPTRSGVGAEVELLESALDSSALGA